MMAEASRTPCLKVGGRAAERERGQPRRLRSVVSTRHRAGTTQALSSRFSGSMRPLRGCSGSRYSLPLSGSLVSASRSRMAARVRSAHPYDMGSAIGPRLAAPKTWRCPRWRLAASRTRRTFHATGLAARSSVRPHGPCSPRSGDLGPWLSDDNRSALKADYESRTRGRDPTETSPDPRPGGAFDV